jgi:microcompartment protein CcmL/EutN
MANGSQDPALGLIESSSIARGILAADAIVKKAPVRILRCQTVSPGKHLTLLAGGVDEVYEAMKAGEEAARSSILDRLFLPQIDRAVLAAIDGGVRPFTPRALGILEYFSVASTILAADAAAKAAEVEVCEMRLASGLGGKGYFILSGELHMLQAAVEAGLRVVDSGLYCAHEIIPAPHAELLAELAQNQTTKR